MNKQQNGQRALAIRMGTIRPASSPVQEELDEAVAQLAAARKAQEQQRSRAAAIAARRKEFATA